MSKHKLFKLGAAAALSVTGVSAMTSFKTVHAADLVTIKQVRINYLPGKSLRIWTSYKKGKFVVRHAKNGSVWNVSTTAVDSRGNLWYRIGMHEWIRARYTTNINGKNWPKTTAKKKGQLANFKVKMTMKKKISKEAKIRKANQIVNKTAKKIAGNENSSDQATNRATAVANLAKEQVGKPYIWGATGPNGFDCSGLAQYVYQQAAGINLPRTTYDQVKVGQTVPLDKLQAGDLIFWGSATAPYHVGIYIGNNQYVNAATPDQGTILQTMTSYYYPTVAKRVL